MTSQLILVAASGLARECAEAARATGGYDVVGYLDDDEATWGFTRAGVKVLGGIDAVVEYPDVDVLVCAGRGTSRETLVRRLATHGVGPERYATLVHPAAHVSASSRIGRGSVILAGCVLTADVVVGEHAVCMPNVVLTHDNVVSDYATICAGVLLGGWVAVGARSYLGMSASVRERVQIGADTVVGMGAVVLADVPAGSTCIGNPAHPLLRDPSPSGER